MDEQRAEISRLQAEIAERQDRLTELIFGERRFCVSMPIEEGLTYIQVERIPWSESSVVQRLK